MRISFVTLHFFLKYPKGVLDTSLNMSFCYHTVTATALALLSLSDEASAEEEERGLAANVGSPRHFAEEEVVTLNHISLGKICH